MPIFRSGGKTFYFAHVPRCGGTSVEDAVTAGGAAQSFLDRRFHDRGPKPWTRTSPQHALAADIAHLFPGDFFDLTFAIVRHPFARFVSAFNFNRENSVLPAETHPKTFIEELAARGDGMAGTYDNHFVPASDFVPKGAHIFLLESGLDVVSDWLREATDGTLAPVIKEKNSKSMSLKAYERRAKRIVGLAPRILPISQADLDEGAKSTLRRIYAADFDRFPRETGDPDRWERD
ncbi:MAG: sulfotransferase family 2 domain-containing protein [Pseudomonadota bacterium]